MWLSFRVRFPGNSQSLCWIPKLGSLTWGSEPSQQWEIFFAIIVLQFVGHPLGRVWDLILSWLWPCYHLFVASSLSLGVGYLFWWIQRPPVHGCSATSCNFVAFFLGMSAPPSTRLSWTRSQKRSLNHWTTREVLIPPPHVFKLMLHVWIIITKVTLCQALS